MIIHMYRTIMNNMHIYIHTYLRQVSAWWECEQRIWLNGDLRMVVYLRCFTMVPCYFGWWFWGDKRDFHGANLPPIPSGKQTVCYWQWPFIVDLPIKNGDFPVRYISLPKGNYIVKLPTLSKPLGLNPHFFWGCSVAPTRPNYSFFLTMVTFHSYVSLLEGNSHNIILSYYHYYCYYYRKIIYKWNIFQQARMPKASRRTDFGRWGPVWLVHFRVLRCQMKQLIFANSRVLEKSRF